ncbi:MAG: hypothetical protein E7227_04340 [Clostridiales bacterium]|nr:hypothetical protein [Clostridiales bacterium]
MSKVTGKLLAMILSFVMVFTGVTFLGGTVAVNAADGDQTDTITIKVVDQNGNYVNDVSLICTDADDNDHSFGTTSGEGIATHKFDISQEYYEEEEEYEVIAEDRTTINSVKFTIVEFQSGEKTGMFFDTVNGEEYTGETVNLTIQVEEPAQAPVVTFDAQGGTVDPTSAEVNSEGKLASLPEPVYEGFGFLGWFDAAEGGNEVTLDTVFEADTTVYAHWVNVDAPYDANDFTYGEFVLSTASNQDQGAVYPANDKSYMLPGTKWVVTGFSASGAAKFKAGHTDLVIPAKDPDGRTVQGVGDYAFQAGATNKNPVIAESGLKVTGVTFPEGVMTTENIEDVNQNWAAYLGKHGPLTEIGDFFIGSYAFGSNDITELVIPEGTLYINYSAFQQNKSLTKVTFPSTLAFITRAAFAQCTSLEEVVFPAETDIRLSIRVMAFYTDKMTSVELPKDTVQVQGGNQSAFRNNTGATTPTAITIKGKESTYVESGNYQTVTYQPVAEAVDAVPATCEEPGQEAYYKCLACGKFFTDEDMTQEGTGAAIPALGHDWELTEVTKEPTADEDGEGLYTCKHDASHTKTDAVSYVYEITFNAGEGASCEVEKVNTGKNGKLKSLPEATNSGKTLIGWFDAEEDGNEVTLDTVFEADATVYARWRDQTPVETVEELVSELPTDVTVDDKDAIEAAREAYEALSAEEKAQLPPTTELRIETAEAKLEAAEADVKADEAQQLANVATAKVILAADIVDATTAGVTAAKYTKSTYDAFVTALDGAKAALKDPAATVESIHAASTDLQTAVDGLKLKGANTMKVTAKKVTFKAATLKKKTLSVAASKAFTVKTPSGKVTYKKSGGNSKITVASTGKITAKKGLKKGTYSVKVKVTAAGDDDHKPLTKTVTVKVVVK